jgi:predicted AlkP superfamily phosphohydrolase/phosphomutase/Flp pilus assembly protein TadD
VLLVGWEAADWQLAAPLMSKGWMPNLQALVRRGASGRLLASPPLLPATLWTTMLTGVGPLQHAVLGGAEMREDRSGVQPVGRSTRRAPALWEWLDSNGVPSTVVGFPATHPMAPLSGVGVSDAFPVTSAPDCLWPPGRREALGALRVLPGQIDLASLLSFIPELRTINPAADGRPALLASLLAGTASSHAAATAALADDHWAFAAVCYAGLAQFSRAFMRYHPPKHDLVPGRDHDLYQFVMTNIYRFHDQMLGRLVELAGDEACVLLVSNHGFHSGGSRPMSLARSEVELCDWHRREGMAVIAGPGVAASAVRTELRTLDVAPTVLSLFGFGQTPEMPGRVWGAVGIQAGACPLGGERGTLHVASRSADDPRFERSLEYLVSLGYQESEDAYATAVAERLEADRQYAVAQVRIEERRLDEAISILKHIAWAHPAVEAYRITLAEMYAATGQAAPMIKLLEEFLVRHPTSPVALAGMGIARMLGGESDEAMAYLSKARSLADGMPWLLVELGRAFLVLGASAEAQSTFARAVAVDDRLATAHAGLAESRRLAGDATGAVIAARDAVAIAPGSADCARQLGLALLASGDAAGARGPLGLALRAEPTSLEALEALARAHDLSGDSDAARNLHRQALNLRAASWAGRVTFETALRTRG